MKTVTGSRGENQEGNVGDGVNEKREGESDKNAIVPEDQNIKCVMKGGEEKGESAGVDKKMDRKRRE